MRYINDNVLNSDRTIAHCVSADFLMEEGLSKLIKNKYGTDGINIEQLHHIGWKFIGTKYILYLVVKEKFWMKPTITDMNRTLINLRHWCTDNNVNELAIPRIGCGIDRLYWNDVMSLIQSELENYGISVDVYS